MLGCMTSRKKLLFVRTNPYPRAFGLRSGLGCITWPSGAVFKVSWLSTRLPSCTGEWIVHISDDRLNRGTVAKRSVISLCLELSDSWINIFLKSTQLSSFLNTWCLVRPLWILEMKLNFRVCCHLAATSFLVVVRIQTGQVEGYFHHRPALIVKKQLPLERNNI